jgi:hypothetical protein
MPEVDLTTLFSAIAAGNKPTSRTNAKKREASFFMVVSSFIFYNNVLHTLPLSAFHSVIVTPSMKYLWQKKKRATVGVEIISAAAISRFQSYHVPSGTAQAVGYRIIGKQN